MRAERITVGVYALDQVLLPKALAKGWAARLAGTVPELASGATPAPLTLSEEPEGLVLAEAARLAGTNWREGTSALVEPVAGRAGLFLVRIGGKAAGLACAAAWAAGTPWQAEGPDHPEALAAFAADTLIDTPDGPRPAGDLVAGDVVTTLGNGSRPLRWVGRQRVTPVELLAHPGLRPVAFAPGTVGNQRALTVSPQQRMLVDDWRAAVYFGEDRVLVSAQALVDDQTARLVLPEAGVDYVVLLCDRHEILLAEGALSESFHPGEAGLAGLVPTERASLAALLPEAELWRRRAAFPIVRHAEARALRLRG
ncbi:MAG: Hint domain-containing protein [Pseudomonadota bacterium]